MGFWKEIYCVINAVFPAVKELRYCDSNIPAMDKIYFLVKGADEALLDSQKNSEDLFRSMKGVNLIDHKKELDEIFRELSKGGISYSGMSVSFWNIFSLKSYFFFFIVDDEHDKFTLGVAICFAQYKKRTGWSMHKQSWHGLYLSNLMSKLTAWNVWVPTTETSGRWWMRGFMSQQKMVNKSIDEIIKFFLKEFKHFTFRTGLYSYCLIHFENNDALSAQSFLWHEMHLSWKCRKILVFAKKRVIARNPQT